MFDDRAANFRVTFTLGRDQLIDALAWSQRRDPAETPPLSKGMVKARIRENLYQYGTDSMARWKDYVPAQFGERLRTWAVRHVDYTFDFADPLAFLKVPR